MGDRDMICERCRKAYPISDIKLMPRSGDRWIALCAKCREDPLAKSTSPSAKSAPKPSAKKDYVCNRCKYRFKFAPSSDAALRCPYCGKADKVYESVAVSADTLIKESTEE